MAALLLQGLQQAAAQPRGSESKELDEGEMHGCQIVP